MRLPDDPNKYSSRFKYIELGRWKWSNKMSKMTVSREVRSTGKGPKDYEAKRFLVTELDEYIKQHGDEGIYTSIFQYDSPDISASASLGPVYFDLDSGDLEESLAEANRLVDHLLQYIPEDSIRLYFSGKKGFHIECEPLAVGVIPHDELAGIFRFIAEDLKGELSLSHLDFSVYDQRRMWRAANTRHQGSQLYKVECMSLRRDARGVSAILEHAKEPHPLDIPEQEFNPDANRWYREYTYKFEQAQKAKREYHIGMLDKFLEQGTSNTHHFEGVREFDPYKLKENCGAFRELERKAVEEHYLTHYERLFLCSLLTYTDEGVMYFQRLLSKLDDYNYEISMAHIEDWIKRREYDIGGRPFTCNKAKEVGIMCPDCYKLEPNTKKVQVGNKWVDTDEQSTPSPIRFAYRYTRVDQPRRKYANRKR